ncbi:hypothetical protein GC177_00085 [bacterium]|nr:hypothetical protein [bacterium]
MKGQEMRAKSLMDVLVCYVVMAIIAIGLIYGVSYLFFDLTNRIYSEHCVDKIFYWSLGFGGLLGLYFTFLAGQSRDEEFIGVY